MVVGTQAQNKWGAARVTQGVDTRRVAVIGAGAAGLCAARHLTGAGVPCVVFEQTSHVGGTWVYNEKTGLDQFGLPVHSSMYRNLRINIPKGIMSYPDFPFPKGGRCYATHQEVRDHLKSYAHHFDLYRHIQFGAHVKYIYPQASRWTILVEDLKSGAIQEHNFDAVLVCNGHFSTPHIPEIPKMSEFAGEWLHSHDYREPSRFAGQDVIVLGASASGMDIAIEVATVANKVYLSHNMDRLPTVLPPNVVEIVGVKEAEKDGFRLQDGTLARVQTMIFSTGYVFDFPFLSPHCGIKVVNNRVTPLYKHMFHRDRPSLAFIGIPYNVIPFITFHYQVRYFLSIWTGKAMLPSRERMACEEEEDFQRHLTLFPERHAHRMGDLQWAYLRDLAEAGSFEDDMSAVVRAVYDSAEDDRKYNALSYRTYEYSVIDKDTFERTLPAKIGVLDQNGSNLIDRKVVEINALAN